MRLSTLVLTLLALAATESVALAAPGKTVDPQKIFTKKDANSDGSLTLEEFKTGMKDKQLENAETEGIALLDPSWDRRRS